SCRRIGPCTRSCELAVLRPFAERERERSQPIARHGGVDGELEPCDLLLHERFIIVLRQRRMPERVVAQLEALLGEERDLAMPPFGLLAFNALVAEERASCFRAR